MKQYLLLTDTHLKDDNIELVTDIFKQAILLCETKKINSIFHLGDWFTSRKAQSLAVLKATEYIISLFEKRGIVCYIIAGNHDKIGADTEESYIDIFNSSCFIVYKKEYLLRTESLNIHLLPYFKETGSYLERLNNFYPMPDKGINILLTHAGLNSVRNNDGTQIENELTPDKFKGFNTVISGHYHNYSKIGENIYYMGSSYQANYGEDVDKGFVILSEDGQLEWIRSEFPKFIKEKVDVSDTKKIKALQKEHAHSKDNVRIVLTGDETQLISVNKEKFSELGIDVKFDKEIIRQDLGAVLETNTNFNRSNIKDAFEQFCVLNDYQDKEIGVEYLKRLD